MPIQNYRQTRHVNVQGNASSRPGFIARRKFLPLLFAAMLLSSSARAAVDMYLDLGDIKGESKATGHVDEVDVLGWSWGMSNPAAFDGSGGTTAGKPSFQDLSLTKYVDKASPKLMLNLAKGTHIPKVILYVLKPGGKAGTIDYIKITLDEVLVTSISTGGSGGEDRLTENISLNFTKVLFEYFPTKSDGTADTAIPFVWDLATNTAS